MKWSAFGPPPVGAFDEPSRSSSSCCTWLPRPPPIIIAIGFMAPAVMPETVPARMS
jgi:hypothetical protein